MLGVFFRAWWHSGQVCDPYGTLHAGSGGGFALHEAVVQRVAGVSDPRVVQFPHAAQCCIRFCACTGFPSCVDGCAHLLAALQECLRFAGVFAAYPASSVPSDPRRDPSPGRVDHLHHHTPMALCDYATTRAGGKVIAGLHVENQTTGTSSDSDQMEALQTDEQITTIKRCRAAAGG